MSNFIEDIDSNLSLVSAGVVSLSLSLLADLMISGYAVNLLI